MSVRNDHAHAGDMNCLPFHTISIASGSIFAVSCCLLRPTDRHMSTTFRTAWTQSSPLKQTAVEIIIARFRRPSWQKSAQHRRGRTQRKEHWKGNVLRVSLDANLTKTRHAHVMNTLQSFVPPCPCLCVKVLAPSIVNSKKMLSVRMWNSGINWFGRGRFNSPTFPAFWDVILTLTPLETIICFQHKVQSFC